MQEANPNVVLPQPEANAQVPPQIEEEVVPAGQAANDAAVAAGILPANALANNGQANPEPAVGQAGRQEGNKIIMLTNNFKTQSC